MALVMEVKCSCGGVGRIFDDYVIRDPKELERAKANAWRTACEIALAAQKRKEQQKGGPCEQT